MLVWRRWIFPLLLLVVCAAIATALVKLAFFPDRTDAASDRGASRGQRERGEGVA